MDQEAHRAGVVGSSKSRKRVSRWKRPLVGLAMLVLLAGLARLALPSYVRNYVNRTLDQNQSYAGLIGDLNLHLWRGAYSIEDVRLVKTTGSVPVPLFHAKRIDLSLDRSALLHGKFVGHMVLEEPELNFVDAAEASGSQTGDGGPWLAIIRDLYPFRIDSATIVDGVVHFRAFDTEPPVDVYLTKLEGAVLNLTNIYDDTAPMFATVSAEALAMDSARFEYRMRIDPFSYRPTYQLALRLLGLDVVKTNALARAYGGIDFERGWFDLVVELDVNEGALEGYVKPLFRDLRVFDLRRDARVNVLATAWEALVGVAALVFRNQERDQVGTLIPLDGYVDAPDADLLASVGNVLRNAFVRAYLPRLQGTATEIGGEKFKPGSVADPDALR